jgi:hypothetical protein
LKISISGIIIGSICVFIGCLLLAGTWGSYVDYNRLEKYSGRAIGHITKKHFQKAADSNANYFLDYWFMANGSKIIGSSVTAKQQWDALQAEDTMEIRYDQSNPNSNVPMYGGSPSLIMALFMMVLAAVFMIFGGSRLFYSFNKK